MTSTPSSLKSHDLTPPQLMFMRLRHRTDLMPQHAPRPHVPAADCSLRQDFAALDTNGDSVLDPSEIRALLEKQFGRTPTDQQFEYFMADIDVDKDGTVSCDEYIANIFDDKAFLVDGKPHEYRTRGCRIPRTEHRASTVRQLCRSAVALRASGGPLPLPVRAAVASWLAWTRTAHPSHASGEKIADASALLC